MNYVFVQKLKGAMSIDVKKNRYDGEVGSVAMEFNPTIRCFSQKIGK